MIVNSKGEQLASAPKGWPIIGVVTDSKGEFTDMVFRRGQEHKIYAMIGNKTKTHGLIFESLMYGAHAQDVRFEICEMARLRIRKRNMKLRTMRDFVLWIRGMTTTELCAEMPTRFPLPTWKGDVKAAANEFIGLDAIKWHVIGEYAKFLSRRVSLGMLIADENNEKVLFKNVEEDVEEDQDGTSIAYCINGDCVLLKCSYPDGRVLWDDGGIQIIEDLCWNITGDIELTDEAIKQILI